jgi:3-hydroxyacyl-CoA dehydrogenase
MGAGITIALLNAGLPVILKEIDQASLDRGRASIRQRYERAVRAGRLTPGTVEQRLALLQTTLTYESLKQADLVIEAVFEDLVLKREVFRELGRETRPETILASNTSSLDMDDLAAAAGRPERVVGLHFFSPAHIMRLIEIVRGRATGADVLATSLALAKNLGKVGVVVSNAPGFVGNRIFRCYRREAQFLVEEGATVVQVDRALEEFGMALGPLATADLAGLDVSWRIRQAHPELDSPAERRPLIEDRLYSLGRYGQKTRAGWYWYDHSGRRHEDPEVERIAGEISRHNRIERRTIREEEITQRTLCALINEGARVLEEGLAARPVDIDMIYVHGYGFPRWRGGPLWHADQVGLSEVLDRIEYFARRLGPWWRPARLLSRLASQGKTFAQWQAERTGVSRAGR